MQNETPPIIPKLRNPRDLSQYQIPQEQPDGAEGQGEDYDDNNPENPFVNFNIRRDSELLQRQY